jgi:hypothetical protein
LAFACHEVALQAVPGKSTTLEKRQKDEDECEPARVEYVRPVGTLYDIAGDVVGCDSTYVNSMHLEAGQVSAFDITFSGRDYLYLNVESYRLQAQGRIP